MSSHHGLLQLYPALFYFPTDQTGFESIQSEIWVIPGRDSVSDLDLRFFVCVCGVFFFKMHLFFVFSNGRIRVVRVAVTVCLDQNKAGGSGSLFVPQLVASALRSQEQ